MTALTPTNNRDDAADLPRQSVTGPSIADVAREAGVSAATVSRILNGRHRGSTAIRDRVQATALALGYIPHGSPRHLAVPRTGALGVLLPNLSGEFFSELLRGLDEAAAEHGIHLLVTSMHADPVKLHRAADAMRGRVDGYLIVAPSLDSHETLSALAAQGPIVVVGMDACASGVPSVMMDNVTGATAVAEHALTIGARHIAMITGPAFNQEAILRRDTFRRVIGAAGAEVTLTEFAGDFSQESGWSAAHTMLAHPTRFDFVFACNDAMATGAMSALRDAGLRVPDSIAMAGFDDVPMARFLTPALTTVHVPIEELGKRAMRMLINSVMHGTPSRPSLELVPVRLIVRGSTLPTAPR